ncbi:MAG: DUF362 domain-containing protein [Chloroflexota bacterium]
MMNKSVVALVKCSNYTLDEVNHALERGFDLLGGLENLVHPDELWLLKPNLLVGSRPEAAVTTHPIVLEAIGSQLQKARVRVTYGDSPGFGSAGLVARISGLAEVAERLNIPLADMSSKVNVSFPEGNLVKQFGLGHGAVEADAILSLPKLKTHGLLRVTGAVKNQLGCVAGLGKSSFHVQLANKIHFAQMLVDLNRLLSPRLVVMDAIVAMEGNGPRGGDPRHVGVLLLSTDPIALDAVACRLINLDPGLLLTCKWGDRWGLGSINEYTLVGDSLDDLVVPDFKVNRGVETGHDRVGPSHTLIRTWFAKRPVLATERCVGCGTCFEVCPTIPKAIKMNESNTLPLPDFNLDHCIRCYCCQEMCPEKAIILRPTPLGRILGW